MRAESLLMMEVLALPIRKASTCVTLYRTPNEINTEWRRRNKIA
ncbi:hypothetical protein HMPREF0682_2558 [Propionibacterium acidifaciens F0233]|uniref:Uncharacterized protein n=1 Tax=Propionibacterium acidifaciens F0233 TaxID=553198 RepID=U2QFD3_9ACTN|nr:hypothetical protein HMPREF0682_2558 [Propionibacterium acidifaciens F0233]